MAAGVRPIRAGGGGMAVVLDAVRPDVGVADVIGAPCVGLGGCYQRHCRCHQGEAEDLSQHLFSPFKRYQVGIHSFDPLHLDFLDVRGRLAVHGPILRLPGDGVRVDARDDVRRGDLLAVRGGPLRLDRPSGRRPGPGRFAEAAVVVEAPRPDALGDRVPADPSPWPPLTSMFLKVAEKCRR